MLVVDRRESATVTKQGPGANRSENESTSSTPLIVRRVAVVRKTPGSEELVDLLCKRIWGC